MFDGHFQFSVFLNLFSSENYALSFGGNSVNFPNMTLSFPCSKNQKRWQCYCCKAVIQRLKFVWVWVGNEYLCRLFVFGSGTNKLCSQRFNKEKLQSDFEGNTRGKFQLKRSLVLDMHAKNITNFLVNTIGDSFVMLNRRFHCRWVRSYFYFTSTTLNIFLDL